MRSRTIQDEAKTPTRSQEAKMPRRSRDEAQTPEEEQNGKKLLELFLCIWCVAQEERAKRRKINL